MTWAVALSALLLAGCSGSPDKPPAAAPPSPTLSPTPSPTPTPKVILDEYQTCVRVQLPMQESVRLVGDFANATDPGALLKQPFINNAKMLREIHEVAAPSLASDIGVVLTVMDAIVRVLRNGGAVTLDGAAVRNSALAVTLACLKLGVSPIPSSS